MGRAAAHPRPETLAIFVTPDAVREDRRWLLAIELRLDGLRKLARRIERLHVPSGHVAIVSVADGEPELLTLDLRPGSFTATKKETRP